MTSYYNFVPSNQSAFSFQPTLDGSVYNVIVTWNLYGQRYYVNCYTLDENLVFSVPLIGSLDGINIQNLTWVHDKVTVITSVPHGYRVNSTINLTIFGATPSAYNGVKSCVVSGFNSLFYMEDMNPGLASIYGKIGYDINLAAGYFTSTLVYRDSTQTFEVTP